ncbi:MAG: hypothetical protein H0T51_08320 [Pirellulales bacterium]|nr:hypothetical protein [Pirellulales bacterium]
MFESLERREMMSITPPFVSPIAPPVRSEQVATSNFFDTSILDNSFVSLTPPVPGFSSRPGASATIYLDFDGHFQDVAAVTGGANLFSPAFAVDADGTNWDFEAKSIESIWARVAEDYAPFNVNVTTRDPGDFSHGSKNLRVVITGEDFRADEDAGGVGSVNAFTKADVPNVVYVFSISKGVAEDDPAGLRPSATIGNLVSHEAGHAFGLEHQSVIKNGKVVEEYNSGDEKKAPIMGNANGSERGIWWKGTNKKGVVQDDMAVLARAENGFGLRPDEGNISFAEPEQLRYEGRALVGRGIINSTSDVDVFRFDTAGGRVEISIQPANLDTVNIGNLDAVIELYDNQGRLLQRGADENRTDAAISAMNLPASNFFVKVRSQGAYGDVGQYRLVVEEFAPPRVMSTNVVTLNSTLGSTLTGVWVQFSKPMDVASFTAADVTASGVSIVSVTFDRSDRRRFLVTVTPPSISLWTLNIGPDIKDQFGFKMDQNRDGIQGGSADVYHAFFLNGDLPTLEQSNPTTTTPSRRTKLSPALVDAAFASKR